VDKELFVGTRFEGDGRKTLRHITDQAGMCPIPVKRAIARGMIARFLDLGWSNHSAQGGTVWVIKEYCDAKEINIEIERPYGSYFIRRV
jgi:hypothetical protein